jgi:hypothetical protein
MLALCTALPGLVSHSTGTGFSPYGCADLISTGVVESVRVCFFYFSKDSEVSEKVKTARMDPGGSRPARSDQVSMDVRAGSCTG